MATVNAQRFLEKAGVDLELALQMAYGLTMEGFRSNSICYKAVVGGDGAVGPNSFPTDTFASKIVTSGGSWTSHIFQQATNTPDEHTPGTQLLGQQFEWDEVTVTFDPILVEHTYLPVDQKMQSPFDAIMPWFRMAGNSLAEHFDKQLFIRVYQAAQTAASTKNGITMHSGGNAVQRVAATIAAAYPTTPTGADNLIGDLEDLMQQMREDNLPAGTPVYLVVNPHLMNVLRQDTTIFSGEYNRAPRNELNSDIIGEVAGFSLVGWTNNMPVTAVSTGPSTYQGTYTAAGTGLCAAVALVGQSSGKPAVKVIAAGDQRLQPIYTYMDFDETRNAWFLKSQMMVGTAVAFPPSAGLLYVTSS